jgi:hypothetical protein
MHRISSKLTVIGLETRRIGLDGSSDLHISKEPRNQSVDSLEDEVSPRCYIV